MNREFVLKMAQAKRMELDAFRSLMPESSFAHIETIGREMRAMVKESVGEHQDECLEFMKLMMECRGILCDEKPGSQTEETQATQTEKKARRVDIL